MHRPVSTNPHTNVDIGGIASASVIHLGSGISFIHATPFAAETSSPWGGEGPPAPFARHDA